MPTPSCAPSISPGMSAMTNSRPSMRATPRLGCSVVNGIVGDLRLGRGDGSKKRRLAGIGQADQAGIGDQLQPQPDGQLLARQAGIGAARRLVGRSLEMLIAETAIAARGQPKALARPPSGRRSASHCPLHRLACRRAPSASRLRPWRRCGCGPCRGCRSWREMLLVAVVDQGVETVDRLEPRHRRRGRRRRHPGRRTR